STPRADVESVPGRTDDELVDAHVWRLLRHPSYCLAQVRGLQHLGSLFRGRRYRAPIQDRCGDLGGTDGAGANAVGTLFHVDGLGQRYHRGFAAVVSGAHHGGGVLAGPGGDIDDDTVLPRPHGWNHGLCAVERAVEVDADHLVPAFDGLVAPKALRVVQSGTVHKDIHRAVARQDALRGALHCGRVADIERLDCRLAAAIPDRSRLALEHVASPTGHDDGGARPRKRLRAGQPDAGSCASNPSYFPFQAFHVFSRSIRGSRFVTTFGLCRNHIVTRGRSRLYRERFPKGRG